VAALVAGQVDARGAEPTRARDQSRWEQGAILKAQVLRKAAPNDIVAFYEMFVARHPGFAGSAHAAGPRARRRPQAGRSARAVPRRPRSSRGTTRRPPYAIGLLSLQLDDYPRGAGRVLARAEAGLSRAHAIYLGMGQAAEGLKRYEEAIGWYQKVEAGDWVRAQLKIATLIARQQGLPRDAHTCSASRRARRTTASR
jgi:hypothetical protein